MEEHAAGPEPNVGSEQSNDPALKNRLAELEAEAARLREQIASPKASSAVPAPEYRYPEQVPEIKAEQPAAEAEPATPEQLAKAENFIRMARLARTRGQASQAAELLKQAEACAPNSPIVLEFIGDDFVERRQFKNAREVYQRAMKIDPKNVAVERKYGEMVLKTMSYGSPELFSEFEVTASAKISVVLTVFLPGLGQVVTGEWIKGVAIFVLWAAAWAWAMAIPNAFESLTDLVRPHNGTTSQFQAIVLVPLGAAALLHLGAIFDSATKAKSFQPRIPIDRPKPPENLPFE